MKEMNQEEIIQECEKHWNYIEKLLRVHNEDELIIQKIHFHYVQAMKHGWKHGMSEKGMIKYLREIDFDSQKPYLLIDKVNEIIKIINKLEKKR